MTIAYYYHTPIFSKNGRLYLPSLVGIFIDSLAKEIKELTLYMHVAEEHEINDCDYLIKSVNVKWINLGKKTTAWHRHLFHRGILKSKLFNCKSDIFLIRCPSPLALFIHKYLNNVTIKYLVVGEYGDGKFTNYGFNLRKYFINKYIDIYLKKFDQCIKNSHLLVNSFYLRDKYLHKTSSCRILMTTMVSNQDLYLRENTCTSNIFKLLYTGRIDLKKGLVELITVINDLLLEGVKVELHIVGWDSDKNEKNSIKLKNLINNYGINNYIIFHGKKSIGKELNTFYRNSDIFIIPSYFESFPRSIWEAMANSIPVIASNVGGIPFLLKNYEDALLIEPKNIHQLKNAILEIINDPFLRIKIIKNAYSKVGQFTLENQTKRLIELINE